jgi:hypothetical protein
MQIIFSTKKIKYFCFYGQKPYLCKPFSLSCINMPVVQHNQKRHKYLLIN